MSVDTQGGKLSRESTDDVACLLVAVETTNAVITRLDLTSALDGPQAANWATSRHHGSANLAGVCHEDERRRDSVNRISASIALFAAALDRAYPDSGGTLDRDQDGALFEVVK